MITYTVIHMTTIDYYHDHGCTEVYSEAREATRRPRKNLQYVFFFSPMFFPIENERFPWVSA